MLPGWAPLAVVARDSAARAGVTARTQRNRILAINHALGGGLVRSFQPSGPTRKWWVDLARLEAALRKDPDARTAELDWLASRVEKLEQSNAALKRAFRQLKKGSVVHAESTADRKPLETVGSEKPNL